MVDAHFATAMRDFIAYLNPGHDLLSPRQLVSALQSHGGTQRMISELVIIDAYRCDDLEKRKKRFFASKRFKMGRANEIGFDISSPFAVKIFEYSGIGERRYRGIPSR